MFFLVSHGGLMVVVMVAWLAFSLFCVPFLWFVLAVEGRYSHCILFTVSWFTILIQPIVLYNVSLPLCCFE